MKPSSHGPRCPRGARNTGRLGPHLRQANTGHPGSITTIHADSATLDFEQLTPRMRESEGGRDLPRDDICRLLHLLVDVVVQLKPVTDASA